MKAQRLSSGKWRVQVLDYTDENGKQHKRSFFGVSEAEAEFNASLFKMERTEHGKDGTVADMVERAIRMKSSALSPSTLRGYQKVLRSNIVGSPIEKVRLSALTSAKLQSWVSWMMGQGLSPKTIKNAYGVFSSCYAFSGGRMVFRVTFPQRIKQRRRVPSIADVEKIMSYFADDGDMTAAIRLCAFASLRRGEICALTAKDIDRRNKTIFVNKAMSETPTGEWIIKPPKTAASVRVVPISDFVLAALPEKGKVVNISPTRVTGRFCEAVAELGLVPFSFHDLRHFYASFAHNRGVSDITIQHTAGWSSASFMKEVYWGEIAEETKTQTDSLNRFIDDYFGQ